MKSHQGNTEFPEKFPIINHYLKCPRHLALFGHNKGDSLRVSLLQVLVGKAVLGNTKGSITNQFPNVQSASSEPETEMRIWGRDSDPTDPYSLTLVASPSEFHPFFAQHQHSSQVPCQG